MDPEKRQALIRHHRDRAELLRVHFYIFPEVNSGVAWLGCIDENKPS